ncbi:MAG: ParA family protein [Firmicutes bacterium]|nr:ParA family protein [Bacillota bacterium]
MSKIIALVNQKGGVGKTTTTAHLAWGLAKKGKKVLAIDFDPQGNLTMGMGATRHKATPTVLEWLEIGEKSKSFNEVVQKCGSVDLLPANIILDHAEQVLHNKLSREYILKNRLKQHTKDYDYILIDCRPSLGILTINALVAADEVLIPIKADYYSLPAVEQILTTVQMIKTSCNDKLKVNGFVVTMADKRRNIDDYYDLFIDLANTVKSKVYKTQIRQNAAAADVPSYEMSLFDYKPNSLAAVDYKALVEEFLKYEEADKNAA